MNILSYPWSYTPLLISTPKNKCVLIAFLIFSCSPNAEQKTELSNGPIPKYSRTMLEADWVPENSHEIDFDNLPAVLSKHAIVSDVRDAGGTRVNQHNYLVYFDGRFWAMWSDGPGEPQVAPERHRNVTPGHDRADQRVSFSTSQDGLKWSEKQDIAGIPERGYGWIARGFWVREGRLLALASRYKAPGYTGEGLQLHAFESEIGERIKWKHVGMVHDNALNNFPPKKIPTGEWMMSRRDSLENVCFMIGGIKSIDQWESFPIEIDQDADLAAEEPYWWILPDGNFVAMYRDNNRSGYLYRAFSKDNGRTWSVPQRTNFPDAKSKFSGLRLEDGRYVIVSNPDPKKRDPLAISISDDGVVFNRMGYLVGGRRVDYPHVIEQDEYLYVAFSSAKQTVEVLKIKLKDLNQLTNH